MKKPVKIIIADDHRLMLEGMATLIESIPGFQLVAKLSSGQELLDHLSSTENMPDVCIVDIEMPGIDGVETVKRIRTKFQDLKVMALTMHHESHFVSRMIAAGANGYLLKNIDRDVFIASIEKILSSNEFILEGVSPVTIENDNEPLTQREKQILSLIARGKSNKEISEDLFISDRTADTHRTNIKRKLKISTLAQLIEYAKQHNLVSF
jgi:two-component system, NarL family, nitrate/nitrite response regulator NarL